MNGTTLERPSFYNAASTRCDDVVDVDYFVPGCPPAPDQVKAVLLRLVTGELPPQGVGGRVPRDAPSATTASAPREKKVKPFHRPYRDHPDPECACSSRAVLCTGSATRAGCGVRCPTTASRAGAATATARGGRPGSRSS